MVGGPSKAWVFYRIVYGNGYGAQREYYRLRRIAGYNGLWNNYLWRTSNGTSCPAGRVPLLLLDINDYHCTACVIIIHTRIINYNLSLSLCTTVRPTALITNPGHDTASSSSHYARHPPPLLQETFTWRIIRILHGYFENIKILYSLFEYIFGNVFRTFSSVTCMF